MTSTPRSIGTATLALLSGLLFAIGPVTVDLSLPALPATQRAIGGQGMPIELTLTLLFFSLAISQLIYGAAADRYGRRLPLLLGLALYTAGSLAAAFATGVMGIAIARVAQAVGYGVVIVSIRSSVADVCDERATARVYSLAILLMSVVAVLAPTLGGLLLAHEGWRSVYLAMAGVGVLAFLLTATLLPETQPRTRRSHTALRAIFSTYGKLLRDPGFTAYALTAAGAVACQFSYNTGGPAVLIDHFGLAPERAGLVLSVIALSTAAGAQANVILLRWFQPERIITATLVMLVAAALALLAVFWTGYGGLWAVVVLLFVIISAPGFITGNAMAAAISAAGASAGAASALVGVMQFIVGTVGSGVVGYAHDATGTVLGGVIVALSGVTLLIALWGRSVSRSVRGGLIGSE